MRLSWNEIRTRAAKFSREWADATYEKGESQSFYNEFFEIFRVRRRTVARCEEHVKRLDNTSGFIDLFWPGVLLAEQKSAGRDLTDARDRAGNYFDALRERDQLLCDFQTFELLAGPASDSRERILQPLDEHGIRNENNDHRVVESISSIAIDQAATGKPGRITHRCPLLDIGHNHRRDALLAIWPPGGKVSNTNIHHNVAQAISLVHGVSNAVPLVIGPEIAAGTQTAVDNETWQVPTIRIGAGAELHLRETKRTEGKDAPLTLVAEPTIEIEHAEGDEVTVTVHGWHEFNPVTGAADFLPAADKYVRRWLLDTDCDGLDAVFGYKSRPFRGRRAARSPCVPSCTEGACSPHGKPSQRNETRRRPDTGEE